MTARDRKLLSILLPFALLAAVWFLLLSPKRKEISRLDGEVAQAHAALSTAQDELLRYQAARRQITENIAALARTGRAVPAAQAIPPLLRQLQRASRQAHVRLDVIQQGEAPGQDQATSAPPADPTAQAGDGTAADPTDSLTKYGLTLSIEGRYFDLQRFFTRLDRFVRVSRQRVEATGRLLSVSSVKLGKATGGFPRLGANVEAEIYALPDLSTLIAQTPGLDALPPQPAPSTATASSSAPTPTPAATAEGVIP